MTQRFIVRRKTERKKLVEAILGAQLPLQWTAALTRVIEQSREQAAGQGARP